MRVEKKSTINRAARPRRSALYMPGANSRALEKAPSLHADVLILDLEDAVAPDAKQLARPKVCEAVLNGFGSRETVIRVNGLDTPWGAADIADYFVAHDLPRHPLIERGYPSIGCAPCTRAVAMGEDVRAGRWWWEDPTSKECGLHVKK